MYAAFVNASPLGFRNSSALATYSFLNRTTTTTKSSSAPSVRPGAVIVRMYTEPNPPKIPQWFTAFYEQLNGRAAMMGLCLGLVTEMITGRGIVGQVGLIFEIWSMAATLVS